MKQSLQRNTSNPNYFITTGNIDEERLRLVNEIYNPITFEFLTARGLKPSMQVLEIGCGYGHTAIWMAQQVQNSGRVCAVDYSIDTLEIAKRSAKAVGVNNIDFVLFDVSKIGEIAKTFDFIVITDVKMLSCQSKLEGGHVSQCLNNIRAHHHPVVLILCYSRNFLGSPLPLFGEPHCEIYVLRTCQ